MPFQMGIDDGQGFIEEHGRHIASHQAAAQGYFLFGIGTQARGFFLQVRGQVEDLGHLVYPPGGVRIVEAPVSQRKGQIVENGHGVVKHRKLEYLGDVAFFRGQVGHVDAVVEHPALAGFEQPGDHVEQRGLAAAGRPQQGVGAAVLPQGIDFL